MSRMTMQQFAASIVEDFGPTGYAPMCSIEAFVQWAAEERSSIRELIELVASAPERDCSCCPIPEGCGNPADGHACRAALCAHYHLPDDPRQLLLPTSGRAATGPETSDGRA